MMVFEKFSLTLFKSARVSQETLTLDQRLLDDLNLDSIKAGDIVATAALQLEN